MRPNVSIAIAYAKEKIVQSSNKNNHQESNNIQMKQTSTLQRTGGKCTLAVPWVSRPEVSVFQIHMSDARKPFANVPHGAK